MNNDVILSYAKIDSTFKSISVEIFFFDNFFFLHIVTAVLISGFGPIVTIYCAICV